jgi:GTPase
MKMILKKHTNKKLNSVNEQIEKEILFAMIGDINAGKSSTINRLIGDEVASVSPKPVAVITIRHGSRPCEPF